MINIPNMSSINKTIAIIATSITFSLSAPIRNNYFGGCESTEYGCCPNTIIPRMDSNSSNCNTTHLAILGGCESTEYGCCPNTIIPRMDSNSSNCNITYE